MDLPAAHRRRWYPGTPRITRRLVPFVVALVALAACADVPNAPILSEIAAKPSFNHATGHQLYASGTHVQAYAPILAATADANWINTVCGGRYNTTNPPAPVYGLTDAAWGTATHNAFVPTTSNGLPYSHPWAGIVGTPWINAWNDLASIGPGGHNWTRYEMPVEGNGSFELKLIADNCSWIYIDNALVGFQPVGGEEAGHHSTYGLTLNGQHTLTFIIFDGGGAAGGNFKLETTSNPPAPLNPDLDSDGHPNDEDAFPLDPTRWSLDQDGDGVDDDADLFPNSNTDPDLIIGACSPGVANWHVGDGAWANDLIAAAYTASAGNHGAFVRAVTALSNGWKKSGLITGREHGAIVSCAAKSK